jgi:exopolysaccharide biosynthesis protein
MVGNPRITACALALVLAAACRAAPEPETSLEHVEAVAPGVDRYRTADSSLVAGAGPVAVSLLRLDPTRVRLASALSNDRVLDAEPVDGIAARHGAIAAINGGFFNRDNGEPTGLLKVGGELVSDASRLKGAVIITNLPTGQMALEFDQLSAKVTMRFHAAGREWEVPIDGVDTTRERGKLMLYTPAYHEDTDTAPTGTEWVLNHDPLRVVDVRPASGQTPIPRRGAALSYGGLDLPPPLAALAMGVTVTFETRWTSLGEVPIDSLDRSDHIINGAGLLRRRGEPIVDWTDEGLNLATFVDARHPRTIIGTDREGFIWLAAVDGRQPDYSIGMTFADLQRLCDRLGLTDALNLDGGGSTTMVVRDRVVNRPSDPGGPRPVSDAIVVTLK